MKRIKSFLLVTLCLAAATAVQAQEVKTELKKNNEPKAPPAETITKVPSPQPSLQPVEGVASPNAGTDKTTTQANTAPNAASGNNAAQKAVLLNRDANAVNSALTPEQLKTLNGTAQKPKELDPAPANNPASPAVKQ